MAEGEGTGEGTGTGAGTGQEGLWRAQLPADLKDNEAFTSYKTLGDLGKAHLETMGKAKDLEGKLGSAIFKPDDKATPEQREAFYRTLGKPEKPTEYELPKPEGGEADPKVVGWAQQAFHKANLSKEQAAVMGAEWNAFTSEMAKANEEAVKKGRTEAETKLKAELGAGYPAAIELTKRFMTKYAKPEDMAFLDESGMGNHPALIRMIVDFAKKTGEDVSVPGSPPRGDKPKEGLIYDKSPAPPKI